MRKHSQKSNGAMRTPNTAPDITLEVPPFLRQQDAGGSSPPPIYNCNFEKVAWTIPQRPETHTAQQAIQKCACPGMRSVLTSVSPGARLGPWRHIPRADLRGGGNPHGKNHAPCMISGISTRKAVLDGKIPAPRIPNRLIAPGNGHMRRGSCHHYLEKHT